jgi:hypothetical protein
MLIPDGGQAPLQAFVGQRQTQYHLLTQHIVHPSVFGFAVVQRYLWKSLMDGDIYHSRESETESEISILLVWPAVDRN